MTIQCRILKIDEDEREWRVVIVRRRTDALEQLSGDSRAQDLISTQQIRQFST